LSTPSTQVKAIRDALTGADSNLIGKLGLIGLTDLAAFGGGVPTLVGRVDLILQDLKQANAGNRLEYCALMTRDATDGNALGGARLDSLELAIASLCPADLVHLATEMLPKLPAALDVAGTRRRHRPGDDERRHRLQYLLPSSVEPVGDGSKDPAGWRRQSFGQYPGVHPRYRRHLPCRHHRPGPPPWINSRTHGRTAATWWPPWFFTPRAPRRSETRTCGRSV